MKLRTLVMALLITALAGLVALAALGVWTWQGVAHGLAAAQQISQVRDKARELGEALDYLVLVQNDAAVAREVGDGARELAAELVRVAPEAAGEGVRRLEEMAALMQVVEQRRSMPDAPGDPVSLNAALRTLAPELRAHEAVLQRDLDRLLDQRHQAVVHTLLRGLYLLLAGALLSALLVVLVSWRVGRRLGAPLHAIEQGLREFSAGRLHTRMQVHEADELGALATAFNEMAERRRESELLLAATIDSSPVPIVGIDADGTVLSWNPAAESVFGWSRAEVLGRFLPIVPDGAREQFAALRSRVLSGEVIAGQEIVRSNRAGAPLTLLLHAAPLLDARAERMGIVGIFEDVTEARARERTLRLQAGALEAVANGILITDRAGVIRWVNPAFCAVTGYSAEQAIGHRPGELIASGVHDREFYSSMWRTIAAGEVWRGELTNRRKDGRLLVVDMSITPLRVSGHDVTHFVAVSQDITDRKRDERRIAEQAATLAEREERLRYLARATVDTVRDWDLASGRVWWNDGLRTQFGYSPEEVEPEESFWSSRLHPQDSERVQASLDQTLAGRGETWEGRYRFRRRDASHADVVERAFIIRDQTGRALRLVGGMTDITERLALEEQLRRSQRLESVGQLTGGIAHDFNNLLTVIQGNAELLTEELAGDERRHALAAMISAAAMRGADLTRRLLAFARRQALEPRPVDVNAMLHEVRGLLARTLGENVEMEFLQRAQAWPALVDQAQLESALLNLCLNARDAMPRGGRLTIETANVELDTEYAAANTEVEAGDYLCVAVSDTGEGMTPEVMRRVFEPFFSTKRGKGSGLGLPMVYGFLKQSKGHISIYSEPGQGTTVRLYLPRASDSSVSAQPQSETAVPGGCECVLLVEDDELVRRFVADQLADLGYRVLEAANGLQALELLRTHEEVDLLFTDIVMPGGMNGRELADTAAALRPGLHVLFTSGYSENAIVHHGQLDPGVALLAKPYRRADLARKLRDVLAGDAHISRPPAG